MTPEEARQGLTPEERAQTIWVTLDMAECEDWLDLERALDSAGKGHDRSRFGGLYSECVRLCHDRHIGQVDPKYLTERMAFWKAHKIRPAMTQSEINAIYAARAAKEGINVR